MPIWDAARYLLFEEERTRPCRDLIARIDLRAPRRVVDLGCGPGTSTAALVARWPRAKVLGVDNSMEMLAKARGSGVRASWVHADLATWEPPSRYDLVFSNAALHWLPDHRHLLPRLLRWVAPRGALAFQMPALETTPGSWRVALARTAARPRWRRALRVPPALPRVEGPEVYYDLLAPRCRRLDLWDTRYLHVMDGPGAILDWVQGSGLRPWLELLPDDRTRDRFLADLSREISREFPARQEGRRLFPFLRRFVLAYPH